MWKFHKVTKTGGGGGGGEIKLLSYNKVTLRYVLQLLDSVQIPPKSSLYQNRWKVPNSQVHFCYGSLNTRREVGRHSVKGCQFPWGGERKINKRMGRFELPAMCKDTQRAVKRDGQKNAVNPIKLAGQNNLTRSL